MNIKKIDTKLLLVIIGLVIFGIVMISSVSVYESYKLMSKIHGKEYCSVESGVNCNNFYLNKHLHHVVISIPVFIIGFLLSVNFLKKISLIFFIASFGLLFSVFIKGVGADYGTAQSWINVPFLPSIQPSEIMKMAIILYFAIWMEKKEKEVQTFSGGFLPFVILLTISILPLALQPDFGSVLVIGMIAVSMFFMAGGNLLHIFAGGAIASFIAWPIILSHDYILKRFLAFLNPEDTELAAGFQIKQSLIAVGSGEFWGVGSGSSSQRFGWLPEVQSDTIFAAAAEELGFFRIFFLICAFAFIALRGFSIAEKIEDRFVKLTIVGITSWITFQAIINIGVTLAMMPLTGITLPFISYGGSSLIMLMFGCGILLRCLMQQNESKYMHKKLNYS